MAVRTNPNVSYGLNQPLIGMPPQPIISQRAPTISDKAEVGTIWVDQPDNDAYILMEIIGPNASWQVITGGFAAFNAVDINPGDLTVDLGNIEVTVGSIAVTAGQIVAGADIVSTGGNITCDVGDISATIGSINAGNNITAFAGTVTGAQLNSIGDIGGTALETAITNVDDHALGVGVMVINTKTANPGANTGYLKFYLGVVPIWVPYFTNIAP